MAGPEQTEPETSSRSERSARFDALLTSLVRVAFVAVGLLCAGLGLAYLLTTITTVAAYGDTKDYLASGYLTEGLHPNRGVVYPQLVHLWTKALALAPTGLHALQVLLLWAALTAFVRRAVVWASGSRACGWTRAGALGALTLATSPLLMHHAVAIMPDALATTWVLVVAMALVDGLRGSASGWRDRRTTFLLVAGLGTAFVRNEHAYVALGLAAIGALLFAFLETGSAARRDVLLRALAFCACVFVSMQVNRAVQRAYPRSDDASLPQMLAVNRIAYGALPSIEPHLAPATRQLFPDVEEMNEHPHKFPFRVRRLLESHPREDVEAAVDDVLDTSIRYDWHGFSTRYYRDWISHVVPDLSYPHSIPDGRPRKGESYWTFSRTAEHGGERLVRSWMFAGQAFVWVLLASAVVGAQRRRWTLSPELVLGSVVAIVLFATLYATVTPSFNPRYALPAAALGHATLVALAVLALTPARSHA